jgi:hypothetical protein
LYFAASRAFNGTNIYVGIITIRLWLAWLVRSGFTFPEKGNNNIVRFSIALIERPMRIQLLTVAFSANCGLQFQNELSLFWFLLYAQDLNMV